MSLPEISHLFRIVVDPELKSINPISGTTSVLEFRAVAGKSKRNRSTGDFENIADLWINVSMYGEKAQKVYPSLFKGNRVYIRGELKTESWKAKDGSSRSEIVLVAYEIAPIAKQEAVNTPKLMDNDPPF